MASKDQLSDWNRRIRRLARAYAPKYRPLVLSLGYHVNLDEGLGRTYIKVETIIAESARYAASGKPLQERYVKRLLTEMVKAGAVKAEDRYREDTGRQTSSYRTLATSLSMDRHGFTRTHDFWAPFDESSQVDEKKDTPQDTPRDTPQDTRTDFELAGNLQATNHHQGPGDDGCQPSSKESQNQGPSAPRPAGADEAPGDTPYEFNSDDREHWAGLLGVPLSSIRESFWTWYGHRVDEMYAKSVDGCHCGCAGGPCLVISSGACPHSDEDCPCLCPTSGTLDCECPCPTSGKKKDCRCQCVHDGYWDIAVRAGVKAAKDAAVKDNPVGYFQTILMQKVDLALHRAMSRAA